MDTVESVWEGKRPGFVYGRYGTGNHAMLEELVAGARGRGGRRGLRLRHGRHHRAAAGPLRARRSPGLGARPLRLDGRLPRRRRAGGSASRPTSSTRPTPRASSARCGRPRARCSWRRCRTRSCGSSTCPRSAGELAPAPGRADRGRVDGRRPPVLRPLEHGATMVMHSLTKFISGHGDVTGGIVLGRASAMERVRGGDDPRRHEPGPVRRVAGGPRRPHPRGADGAAVRHRAQRLAHVARGAAGGGARVLPGPRVASAARAGAAADAGAGRAPCCRSTCAAARPRWSASWRARGSSSSRRASATWPRRGPIRRAPRTGASPTRTRPPWASAPGWSGCRSGWRTPDDLIADLGGGHRVSAVEAERRRGRPVTLEGPVRPARAAGPRARAAAARGRLGLAGHLRLHAVPATAAEMRRVRRRGARRAGRRPRHARSRPWSGRAAARWAARGSSTSSSGRGPPGNAEPARRRPAGRGRDRLDVARRRRAAHGGQHRGQAPDAHPRVRDVAGPPREPA